ncbi:MAG: hypothetical protein U0694_00740 [Anaerolineae bacterium]
MSVSLDKQLVYELEHRDSRRRESAIERLGKSDSRLLSSCCWRSRARTQTKACARSY